MLSPIGILQPKIVEALLGYEVVRVSCGPNHIMAVTNDNEVFAWGKTDSGWWEHYFDYIDLSAY